MTWATFASAQPLSNLTTDDVKAAIQLGQSNKVQPYWLGATPLRLSLSPDQLKMMKEHGVDLELRGDAHGVILTPFMRVALASQTAREVFKPFAESEVTPELLEPIAYVVIWPVKKSANEVVGLKHIVMMPNTARDDDVAQAIQPLWTKTDLQTYQNAFGAVVQARGMVAGFPLSALTPANRFILVWEGD